MNLALRTSLALAVVLASAAPAHAAGDDALYRDLGGTPGIQRIVDGLVTRATADPRIATFFAKTNLEHLRESLSTQVCMVSGGPCAYDGPSMAVTHQDMEIRKGHFNALVEDLQQSMDAQGVPFAVQNRLLARLAPMHRDIVNAP